MTNIGPDLGNYMTADTDDGRRIRAFLYAVNARFSTPPTPDTTYTIVRVSAR